jgi:hypothetical protein
MMVIRVRLLMERTVLRVGFEEKLKGLTLVVKRMSETVDLLSDALWRVYG